MRQVQLAGTSVTVSRFAFGTAGLFGVRGGAARRTLLEAAVDAGFTHFDTAPYYGFGVAERALAPLLRSYPHLTIATKVGLYSPGGEQQPAAAVFARKVLGRILPVASKPTRDFALARAQRALAMSLRRLGVDHVALYLLHEPDLALLDADAWLEWLTSERQRGRIGAFGVAADASVLPDFLSHGTVLANVVQTIDSVDRQEADVLTRAGRPLQITYGYVSAARQRGDTCSVPDILRQALRRNATGSILVSTTKVDRLRQYAEILASADHTS